MKRMLVASLAALALASPIVATEASARPHDRYDRYDRDYDNRDDRRDERRAYNEGRRDGRHDARHARFDRRHHNGYYVGSRWYYGPPPAAYYNRSDFRVDYRQWHRGERLPQYYRDSYRPVDYRAHRLSAPPRGAYWTRDDRGDYLLVGVATGVILGLALGN